MRWPWGQAFEKFLNMVQAGETPDIVEMPERWLGLYANNGQLEDLGPYMKDWPEAATLGERAKHFGSVVKNTQYMNIIVGIIGAYIGAFLANLLGLKLGEFFHGWFWGNLIVSIVGAVILIAAVRAVRRSA